MPQINSTNPATHDAHGETHHPTLYLPTGDVVLSATTARKARLFFRIHIFMLARQSPVFQDMFTFVGQNDLYEDTPHIHMEDNARDLEGLLQVLYDPTVLPYKHHDPNTPVRVLGVLKLATKYQFDTLRERIVNHFQADWPRTLYEWDASEALVEVMDGQVEAGGPYLDDMMPEPGAAIQLARQCDIPQILPAAFYHLSRLSMKQDWDECRNGGEASVYLVSSERTARWYLLSREDFRCLLAGREALHQFVLESPQLRIIEPSQHCLFPANCRHRRVDVWKMLEVDYLKGTDPLGTLRKYCASKYSDKGFKELCAECYQDIRAQLREVRVKLWNRLPEFFSLSEVHNLHS
ncbi:hypothetical protein BD410DRAFT_794159 [Rickenella mellea]|uniref:BTB domain-containing protein n=1 Tax=Rickenella mellea TaxID=50990 RepID=A0A4Y7PQN5_9AGAM|nr:hypothetical protein BD410DRAFT_794159 [Rickenella mellea]